MTAPRTGGSMVSGDMPTKHEAGLKVSRDDEFTMADVDPIGRTEVMIYGPPGCGKTVMAATFPKPFRWLAADGQNALKSVRWAIKAGKSTITDLVNDMRGYVPHEVYQGKGMYVDTPKAFHDMNDRIDRWFSKEDVDTWQTLVIDTATELDEWSLNLGLKLNNQLPTANKPLSDSHKINTTAKARIIVGQQDYKSSQALFYGFMNDLRGGCAAHNKNLVVLCHEYVETDDDGNVMRYLPLLNGQLRQRLPKSFDDLWYMNVYNGKDFKIQMHPDPRHPVKSRWGQVFMKEGQPVKEVDADFRSMMAEVRKFHGL